MDLQLSRVDYVHIGSSFPNCLKLLPGYHDEKGQQKVVIANREQLQILSWRKSEPIYTCNLPFHTPLSSLSLGGAIGGIKDKVFIACGNIVKGFTKKGKMFLEFDTNLAETIRCLCVVGSYLLVSGLNVYCQYEDCKDARYYVCDDEINFIISLSMEKVKALVPVLACKDRTIRVLSFKGELRTSINLDEVPTCLILVNGDGGEAGVDIIFGTGDGKFGLLTIDTVKNDSEIHWIIDTEVSAGVTCMDFFDLTNDGNKELAIGYDDGTVLVYTFDLEDYYINQPRRIFSQTCNESVMSLKGGIFGNEGFEEILVVTYSGWVFGLTTETSDKNIKVDEGSFSISDDTRLKLVKLKDEIEELQLKVSQEREKFQNASQNSYGGVSVIPHFAVNEKMILCRDDASYLLTLEVESPIDTILIQSDVPVDLLDIEKNSAVVSFSQADPENGNFLLTTFRCQANTTRIEIRLRTIEGQSGDLRAYITPRIQPKCCLVRTFKIKPLSLHVRHHNFDPNRPYNTLILNGSFGLTEIHSWLVSILPEMPERVPASEEISITFISSFLETILHCSYSKGQASFKSDNVSTISILKDWLTREATKKKIQLDIDCEFNEESVLHVLQLIRPKMNDFILLTKQVGLIDALKEIEAHEPDANQFLSSEYKYILENADKLKATLKRTPSYLERLYGMITDLYIDKHKYNGINVKSRIPSLIEVLERQDFNLLIDFFQAQVRTQNIVNNEY